MSLRDYYRCKKCDSKIAYGPDRPEQSWDPFLLCRSCIAELETKLSDAAGGMEYWKEANIAHIRELNAVELRQEREAHESCDTPDGLTIGLIDSLITVSRVAAERIEACDSDLIPQPILDALSDLFSNSKMRYLMSFGGNADYATQPLLYIRNLP